MGRGLFCGIISVINPLRKSYREEEAYYPIPPSLENIKSLDMVLHIPVAIDFLYGYLNRVHYPEGSHLFALYIDLRFYDMKVADGTEEEEDVDYSDLDSKRKTSMEMNRMRDPEQITTLLGIAE